MEFIENKFSAVFFNLPTKNVATKSLNITQVIKIISLFRNYKRLSLPNLYS